MDHSLPGVGSWLSLELGPMDVRPVVSPSPYGSVYYAVRTACCIAPGTDITLCVYVQHVSPFLVYRLAVVKYANPGCVFCSGYDK
jgi:hypothetical protein